MLKIYGSYRSRASRNIWMAKELGIPYQMERVVQAKLIGNTTNSDTILNTASAEFMALNPNGEIPTIEDDGLVLYESLAINLYLANKHGAPLGPVDQSEFGLMAMWTLWTATKIEPEATKIIQNRLLKPAEERDPATVDTAVSYLRKPIELLDEHLASKDYLVGNRFTVADINTAECVRFASAAPELFQNAERVTSWLERCHSRPAFKEMRAERESEPTSY